MISIIITTYNEGDDIIPTLASLKENTSDYEIIVIDDGSTDGSCDNLDVDLVIKHKERIGIAYSRNEGVEQAKGDAFCFLDAHHLVTPDCINICCEEAIRYGAITWPCVRGLKDREPRAWTGHGADMAQKVRNKKGLFEGIWRRKQPIDRLSRSQTMIVPGYCVSRDVWPVVKPADGLRGWGASEPAIAIKAFFACVDILHVCGPMCRHGFRPGKHLPYSCRWNAVVRNHGITARVCFDDDTWQRYWKPKVIGRWLDDNALKEFDEPHITKQHEAFQQIKRRPDHEFWLGLIDKPIPDQLKKGA